MRKFGFVGLAAGVLGLFALAAVAFAGSVTSPSGHTQTLEVTHTPKKAGAPVKTRHQFKLSKADGSKPTIPTRVIVRVPKGMGLNYRDFPSCTKATLEAKGPEGCPKGSQVGKGTGKGDARPVISDPVNAQILAFNGREGGKSAYIFYAVPDLGPIIIVVGKLINDPEGPYGMALDFTIPPIQTLPGQPNATITEVDITTSGTVRKRVRGRKAGSAKTKKVGYLGNPRKCSGKWEWRFDWTYENGEKLSPTDSVPCSK